MLMDSPKYSTTILAFNNSGIRLDVSDSSWLSLKCFESANDQKFLLLESFLNVADKREVLIYIPMNSKPSYEGRSLSINWYIEKYKGKKQIDKYKIKVLFYPYIMNLPQEYNIKKIDSIYIVKNNENKIVINYESEVKTKKVYVEFYELHDGKYNQLYSKELDYYQDSKKLFLNISKNDFPTTYVGYKTGIKSFLVIEEENGIRKLPVFVYDFHIFESIKLGDVLEAMIFKHLALYGPQTLGMLVSNIALKEKIRVKSIDVKESCKEMYERNLLEKNDRDWNSATYFLNSKIYELYIKR